MKDSLPRCKRCGRKLTDPEALVLGYGRECAKELGLVLVALGDRVEGSPGNWRLVKPINAAILHDLLLLVGYKVTIALIDSWSTIQSVDAFNWARATHLSASDNPIHVPKRPRFLDQYAVKEVPFL